MARRKCWRVFVGRDIHQGYPARMHGGAGRGILDEVMSRCIAYGDEALNPPVLGCYY